MIKWLSIPDQTKRNAFTEIAVKQSMSSFAVEKDWWVVQTLSIIFEMEAAKHLVFKGGTSLSKAWNLIERFSEDIDLAIDRSFFGFGDNLTKRQRTDLRKSASKYTSEEFFTEIQRRFKEKGFEGLTFQLVEAVDSDQDPRIIEVYYPNIVTPPGYLEPKIQIEIGCRSLKEPFTIREFSSLVDEHYPDKDFSQSPIKVPTVNPERTFLEKLFLLHEEFQRPHEKVRVDRLSRHLYDLVKLARTDFVRIALADKELYEKIVEHRQTFTRLGGVNYNLHQPQTLNPVPPSKFIDAWKNDYATMLEQMIYEDNPPSFDDIIRELTILRKTINSLTWQFKKIFPVPKP
jgi:predicted nucleotidyltransferase component of viral defense system